MFRFWNRIRLSRLRFSLSRSSSSSPSSSSCSRQLQNSIEHHNDIKPPRPPFPIIQNPNTTFLSPHPLFLSRPPLYILSATLISAIVASYALYSSDDTVERVFNGSNESAKRIVNQMKQTGVAASVLWQSLMSVMSSANQEVRQGFELKVAALLADIAAANSSRRAAIVAAGGGRVVDWLLETVAAVSGENSVTQAESARALAYLLADHQVCEDVLARPNAVPNLLRFIFASQPQRSKKHRRHSSLDTSDSFKGRSMLVAAIMDIVTSSCDSLERASFHPSLPANAEMRDIAAAIEVIEEGGMHLDESDANEDDNDDGFGGMGIKGIGIKVLGGTPVLGISGASGSVEVEEDDSPQLVSDAPTPSTLVFQKLNRNLQLQQNMSSIVVPGLWDDLLCQHVAVPFAAWALASWAKASSLNRSHIQELDQDGLAVMAALMAPERSVKWHGSLVARLLLEDNNLPLNDAVSEWSSSLLSTISHASKTEDISLAQVALSAFLVSVERCPRVQQVVMEKGLNLMRESTKQTMNHKQVQGALAKALELLCTRGMHLSLEESRKWSGILLQWVCGKDSSASTRSSATKILSCIFEEYGPSSLPISQGWLAILLAEILGTSKRTSAKGISQPKSDRVKTQIDQANLISATQVAGQLAGAVVNLAAKQLGTATDSVDTFPLADLLSLEPFSGPFKNINKNNLPKLDAADSAVATLKGIKALTDICTDDSSKNKIIDLGVLCLLRRFLLQDDYEKLAAIQAYDASRSLEAQERGSSASSEAAVSDTNNSSSVRVPPTAHMRRHAARLLAVLSVLPNAREVITADEIWCKWLEECADGKVPGCNDPKIQSYARTTLLHVYCDNKISRNSADDNGPDSVNSLNSVCPHYDEMIFLISPEQQHWKCYEKITTNSVRGTAKPNPKTKSSAVDDSTCSDDLATARASKNGSGSISTDVSNRSSQLDVPPLDVVFVHGLRGGPFKSWRITEDKSSTQSGLVERIDQEAGKLDTFWPGEWLPDDFPYARIFSLKYKTNLTQWSGATLPLQEVSSMLLDKLVAAGIGDRPVVFVTHSMGGLVVKQILYQAKAENLDNFVNNTVGVVFYSCPHFGSKLADMPWRMGLVLRPAPTIGELRSGSPRLVELNDYIRQLHKKGLLEVLSFGETKVTPIVEGYGGWAFRMEIVPIESAYPGFGELVILESTDHINSCKPVSRSDPSYTETLQFLNKLKTKLHVNEEEEEKEEKEVVNGGEEPWVPSIEGFVKYLVDYKLVFDDKSGDVSYAYFRKTGLGRLQSLSKDLEWLVQQDILTPEPSSFSVSYATFLEGLAEKSAPLFYSSLMSTIFFTYCWGQVITKQLSEKLFEGKELEFCRWEGDALELLKGVRENMNMLGDVSFKLADVQDFTSKASKSRYTVYRGLLSDHVDNRKDIKQTPKGNSFKSFIRAECRK
ncbi:hypothetical protein RJ641_032223 [Dillenia turbinata]|uniref:GPI inositol-deacylase n=1 Tax=Dillenia turbinata TaxID=194707 RepID=A0AAN8ZLT2_9MAGN